MAWSDLPTVAKDIINWFKPSTYESRVLRGLVGTGDKQVEYTEKFLDEVKGGDPQVRKYLRHYCRKWKADRLKLR